MGKASRTKRRAAVRSAKRARTNSWWYALTAIVVIAGVSLIVYAHLSAPASVGPYVANQANQLDPHNRDSHWHAALGVYDCDHWVGDSTGAGLWAWPNTATINGQQTPGRAGANLYAGLHSHGDGIIHMEPQSADEEGRHATVGKYFDFGGWKLSSTGYDFVGTKVKNGDKCGNAAGTLTWALGKWDGSNPPGKQKYTLKSGNPASYKLFQGDIVIIAFLPPGKTAADLGNPPSLAKLPSALGVSEQQMAGTTGPTSSLPNEAPTNAPSTSTPPATTGSTPTTAKP